MTMLPPDPLYIFKGNMGPVFCLMFRNINAIPTLYAGTQMGSVHVWNIKTDREIGRFESSKESCLSIHSVTKAEEIITQDKLGAIRFWMEDGMKWNLLKEIETNYYGFCKSVVYNDIFYVPAKNAHIESISVKEKEKMNILSIIEDDTVNEIMCLTIFDVGGETVALIALESWDLYLYSLKEKKRLSGIKVDECPMAVEFDTSIMKGVCGCPTEKLTVFCVNRSFEMKFYRNVILKNPGVASLGIRPDGKLLAVGCWDGKLRLYSMKSLSILAVLDVHSSTVEDILFFNAQDIDEKPKFYLSAASKDGKISLWDLYN